MDRGRTGLLMSARGRHRWLASFFGGLLIRADLRYDLARELRDLEELENPSEGRQPW
jgi:hypothetical protein